MFYMALRKPAWLPKCTLRVRQSLFAPASVESRLRRGDEDQVATMTGDEYPMDCRFPNAFAVRTSSADGRIATRFVRPSKPQPVAGRSGLQESLRRWQGFAKHSNMMAEVG